MRVPTGALKVAIHAVALLASVLLAVVGTALLPPWLSALTLLTLLGALVLLAAGALEGPAVRLLMRARSATTSELQVLAVVPGLVADAEVLVRRRPAPAPVKVMGRRTVISAQLVEAIYRGQVSPQEAAAIAAYARGHHRVAAPRAEVTVAGAQIPWRTVAVVVGGIVRTFTWLPLVSLAWRLRGMVGVVCLVQSVSEGPLWPGVLGATVILLTYLVPAAARTLERRAEATGDRAVIEQGLGASLAAVLQRSGQRVPPERLQRLLEPPPGSPAAGWAADSPEPHPQPALD